MSTSQPLRHCSVMGNPRDLAKCDPALSENYMYICIYVSIYIYIFRGSHLLTNHARNMCT